MNKKINPCGNSMRELSTEELVNIYGADTATPISTIPCSVAKTVSVVSKSVVNSSKVCIGASLSAISGIFSYNKECLGWGIYIFSCTNQWKFTMFDNKTIK